MFTIKIGDNFYGKFHSVEIARKHLEFKGWGKFVGDYDDYCIQNETFYYKLGEIIAWIVPVQEIKSFTEIPSKSE